MTSLWSALPPDPFKGDGDRVYCHPRRGSKIDPDWFTEEFRAALKAVGITERVRPFHDHERRRGGSSQLAVMAKAGHRSMATTPEYVHLAGVGFGDETAALDSAVQSRTDLSESPPISQHPNPLGKRQRTRSDLPSEKRWL